MHGSREVVRERGVVKIERSSQQSVVVVVVVIFRFSSCSSLVVNGGDIDIVDVYPFGMVPFFSQISVSVWCGVGGKGQGLVRRWWLVGWASLGLVCGRKSARQGSCAAATS